VSDYVLTLPDGRQARVPMPQRLTLKRRMSDEEARAAIHRYIVKRTAKLIEPSLAARPSSKEIVRDERDRIVRLLDVPAASAAEQAEEIGRLAADQYVSEIDW
jgi:hypothetical protein